jgi:sulfur carrier protein ThiS
MPNELNTPEWVRKHNEQKAEEARLEAAATEQRRVAVATVHAGGPDFWTRFVERTIVNVRVLPDLKDEELVGSASHALPGGMSPEHHLHIQVNRQSVRFHPALSKMNLWYAPGGNQIRRWYQDQEMPNLVLCASGEGVVASVDGRIYTAEQLADHVVEWMAARVQVRRSA